MDTYHETSIIVRLVHYDYLGTHHCHFDCRYSGWNTHACCHAAYKKKAANLLFAAVLINAIEHL